MVLKDIKESGKEMGLDKMFKVVDSTESGKINVI
jgi:Ca2+-binding EF-hand superfamily protein